MAEVNTRKRGNKWQYYFEIAKVGDKRRRICKSGFDTKKEAVEAGIKALAAYNNCGDTTFESDISISDFSKIFINYCKNTLKYSTYVSYESVINAHLLKELGNYKIINVTTNNAEQYANTLKKQGLSHGTIKKNINVVKTMFDYAIKKNIRLDNPFIRLRIPQTDNTGNPNKAYTDTEIKELKTIYQNDVLGTVLMLGYHCGLRLSESLALTWNDIDFENNTITINKQLICRSGIYYFTTPKYNSVRIISIDDNMITYLKSLKECKDNYPIHKHYVINIDKSIVDVSDTIDGIQLDTVSFVVSKIDSSIVSNKYIHNRLDNFKHQGYKVFRTHDLRHTHCTKLLMNGLDVKYVQKRMGHKSVVTTMNIYTHLTDDKIISENEKLNNLF